MKHLKRMTAVMRAWGIGLCTSTAALFLTLVILLPASGSHAQVTVAVGNGFGAPGGTASVTSTLTGGDDKAALVGYDVVFDTNVLDIQASDCVLAPRLVATHAPLQVFLPQPGRLRIGVLDLTFPIATFPDGDLATCTFHINANAALGTTPLTMENLEVSDNSTPPVVLPSTEADGVVTIALVTPTSTTTNTPELPTNTPTSTRTNTQGGPTSTPTSTRTSTPGGPTSTPTSTVGQPTSTPTATRTRTPGGPTPTNTGGAGFNDTGGGCNIQASGSADAGQLAWLIVPAALLLRRRRAQTLK